MLLKDLQKAIWERNPVDIIGVKLRSWGTDHQLPAVLHISFDMPSVENKPVNDNLDIAEVRLSTKPKYDSCREFRAGDKVRMVMRDGRHPYCTRMCEHIVPSDTIGTVVKCELNGFVAVEYNNGYKPVVHFSFLELVTPVEAEPYFISEGAGIIELYKSTPNEVVKTWFYDAVKAGVEALAEAEAECARLNAEYRKELE